MKIKDSTKGAWAAFFVILICIALGILIGGCTSKSSQTYAKYEKCVVIDTSYPTYYIYNYAEGYRYRLKRIENQNIITTLYNPNIWHTGDTILLRFSNVNWTE